MNKENPLAYCLKCRKSLPGDKAGLCPNCYKEIFYLQADKYRCSKCGMISIEKETKKKCPFCSEEFKDKRDKK